MGIHRMAVLLGHESDAHFETPRYFLQHSFIETAQPATATLRPVDDHGPVDDRLLIAQEPTAKPHPVESAD